MLSVTSQLIFEQFPLNGGDHYPKSFGVHHLLVNVIHTCSPTDTRRQPTHRSLFVGGELLVTGPRFHFDRRNRKTRPLATCLFEGCRFLTI